MSDLTVALNKIKDVLVSESPSSVAALQPGLSLDEIQQQVQALPFELPQELYELYQWRNGIVPTGGNLIPHYEFYSLERAIEEFQYLKEIKQEWIDDGLYSDAHQSSGELSSEAQIFALDWLPIFGSDDLEYYFIVGDEEPQDGSPLFRCHLGGGSVPDGFKYRSLTHYFQVIAECYEVGAYLVYEEDGWVCFDYDEEKIAAVEQKYDVVATQQCLDVLHQVPITLEALDDVFSQILKFKDERMVEPTIRLLNLPVSEVKDAEERLSIQMRAAMILGELGDQRAVEPLLQVIETSQTTIKSLSLTAEAVKDLGNLEDVSTSEPLKALLIQSLSLMAEAVKALEQLGDISAILPLRELLSTLHDAKVDEKLNQVVAPFAAAAWDEDPSAITGSQFYSNVLDTLFSAMPTDESCCEQEVVASIKRALESLELLEADTAVT